MKTKYKVVIVGMGPAGISAAIELAQCGLDVALVDENEEPGGQVYRHPPKEFTIHNKDFLGLRYHVGQPLMQQFYQHKDNLKILTGTLVWGAFEDSRLSLLQGNEIKIIEFDNLLLCEGAMERSIPFPGWTLPGIMTIGGLQKLLLHQRLLPGKRIVLSGSSPLLFPVAASLLKAGGEIVALCDTLTRKESISLFPEIIRQRGLLRESFSYLFPVYKHFVPIHRPYAIVGAAGDSRVNEVTISKLDERWNPIAGSERKMAVDIVAVSYGFLPLSRLTRLCGCKQIFDPVQRYWKPWTDEHLQTSISNVYSAGDSAGVGGADLAEVDGRIVAVHLAAETGQISAQEYKNRITPLFKKKERINRYVTALNRVFAPRTGLYNIMDDDTIVCRCEQITAKEIYDGIDNKNYSNINEMKRTRIAMGPCQGRVCESIVAQMMRNKGITPEKSGYLSIRPPITPVSMSMFETFADSP